MADAGVPVGAVSGTTCFLQQFRQPVPITPVSAKSEEPAVAHRAEESAAAVHLTPAVSKMEANWPGFRGPSRDGIIAGTRIQTN